MKVQGDTGPPAQARPRETLGLGVSEQRKREMWFALVSLHLPMLYRFVRHELAYYEARGDLLRGELTAEEVVDAMLLRAQREFFEEPMRHNTRGWLVRRAREYLEAEVERVGARRDRSVPLQEDSSELPTPAADSPDGQTLYFYDPQELDLEALFPDIDVAGAPAPDEEAEIEELRSCVDEVLAKMPCAWRQALLLHYVDGLAGAELAEAIGRPQLETERILEQARDVLRRRLIEAGCTFGKEPGGSA